MKKMTSFVGMLAIAAILTACFSACSNEEILDNTVQPTQPQKIHVTVGAGLGDAETRSKVDYDATAKTRTLKFTTGDRLYIVGDIDDKHRMGGYLDLTSGDGTTSATFSGDLTVWVTSNGSTYTEDNTYTLQHANPMEEYGSNEVKATLIHKDAISSFIYINNSSKLCSFNYSKCLVTDQSDNASKLMETGIHVRGTYDATTESFPLACGDPIFNCNFTIDGLAANTAYYVRVVKVENNTTYNTTYGQMVTTDAKGYVHFACTTNLSGEGNWKIEFSTIMVFPGPPMSTTYERLIGNKTLGAKVYNVGNYTAPDPNPDPDPTPDPTLDPTKDVVSLSQVTSAFIGNVVGSDGLVYPPDATMPEGVSKAAMVCYVSSTGHGLAIELNSSPSEGCMPDIKNDVESKAAVAGHSWRLPSPADWDNMVLNGCGGADGFVTKYNATGVSFLIPQPGQVHGTEYWTSRYEQYYVMGANNSTITDGTYDAEFVKFTVTNTSSTPQYNFEHHFVNSIIFFSQYYLGCFAF